MKLHRLDGENRTLTNKVVQNDRKQLALTAAFTLDMSHKRRCPRASQGHGLIGPPSEAQRIPMWCFGCTFQMTIWAFVEYLALRVNH